MAAITVKFERIAVTATHTFENVVNVEWEEGYAVNSLVNDASKIGPRITTFTVNGFIKQYGDPSHNVEAQQALVDALTNVGTGTLSYTGVTDIEDVRFLSIDFEEYRGSPIAQFSASFVTERANVFAHTPVSIGAQALTLSEGFELPQVEDSIQVQGPDEQLNNLKRRKLLIKGDLVGANIAAVNTAQAKLVAAVENLNTVVVQISLPGNGGVSLTMRPRGLNFGSPKSRGTTEARSYSFEAITHDDYTKEPYTLGESSQTFATVQLDVVGNIDHNIEGTHEGGVYIVNSENATVSGTKYFANWAAYDVFVQSFQPFPLNPALYVYGSPNTYQQLELRDINISEFTRDGNFANEDKRYSAKVSMSFAWFKNLSETSQNISTTFLGVLWFKVTTTTHSFSVDEHGSVVARSVSLSGQLADGDLAIAKLKMGTAVLLGDAAIPGGADDYYITSVNVNKTDVITVQPGNILTKLHDVSITANQLGTATQKKYFIIQAFDGGGGSITLDKVTSMSRSFSNRYVAQSTSYVTVSGNYTISGEIWEADNAGAPANPNRGFAFMNLFDATQTSAPTPVPPATYPAAVNVAGKYLPTNYSFFITSISVGEWQSAIKPNAPNQGQRHWRQTVSLSATAVFDIAGSGGSNTEPDTVETISEGIQGQTTKFTELQVLGLGTIFKAIGINPATANQTIQIQYRTKQILATANPVPGTRTPSEPGSWGIGSSEQTKNDFNVRGLSATWAGAWKATEKE